MPNRFLLRGGDNWRLACGLVLGLGCRICLQELNREGNLNCVAT
jgi:hypothetical protein